MATQSTLPALQVQQQQQPDLLQKYSQLMALKNSQQQQQMMQQEAPLRMQQLQQGVQAGGIQLQQEQQGQQDQQAFRAAMSSPENQGKTIGEVADVLGRQGNLSPATWQQLKKADIDTRTSLATLDDKQLANMKAAHDATQQLYNNVMDMPDDQLAANWQSIAQQYDAIPGNNKQPLNPNQPLTKQQLAQFGPAISLNNTYLDQALARRKTKTAEDTAEVDLETKRQGLQYGPSGPAADSKYRFLQTRLASKQPVTADDQAWMKGYEKQKLLVPATTANIRVQTGSAGGNDIHDTAQMIASGEAPPVLTEYSYRDRTKLAGELHRMGYNLAGAEQDWKATQKYLATLNGAQQTRLRQAIQFTSDTLPQIQDAFNQWKATGLPGGFESFNTAALKAAEKLPGKAGSAAHNLDALISDFTSELGTVYKGGNSSTDESLKLAAQNLGANWNEQSFMDALARIDRSMKIRKNSINVGSPVGVSGNSQYAPPGIGQPNDPFSQFGGKAH